MIPMGPGLIDMIIMSTLPRQTVIWSESEFDYKLTDQISGN